MTISVLRWGHRSERDKRVTTHVALVSRAFGASSVVYSGERDASLEESVRKVAAKWGGPFSIRYTEKPMAEIRSAKRKGWKVAHLTMYGAELPEGVVFARKAKNLLVVVGAEKMPPEVYTESDWNVSVTNQPHSEVAALAVFLHEVARGKEVSRKFKGAQIVVMPSLRGKVVVSKVRRKPR
ncbi:MAG TPA: tRNA (cytidine(56)-2'-O)-methyltransferase [Candidatus Norongarragalinales archaeon]|jgi:tRNA (cytidine56-2'-O)-methyltransferase|nr:tRNA (cytidine(56)-2'-O)-methyltransferase [Candidatus Norongarragalinales archaeon]